MTKSERLSETSIGSSMFSRQHYQAIAETLRERLREIHALDPGTCKACQSLAVRDVINDLALMLSKDNDRFDFDRFVAACGVGW